MNPESLDFKNPKPANGVVLCMGMVRRGECESLQKNGLVLGMLLDTNNQQRLADVSKFAFVERFDFSLPPAELLKTVSELRGKFGIDCLFNVNELYVTQTAEIAAALGIPGISPASARLCLDKTAMRPRFQERIGPENSAGFFVVNSEAGLLANAERLGYPVFLQPSNVSASMWATRNDNAEALLASYRTMLRELPPHYQKLGKKSETLKVVLAQYLAGDNTSLDCLVDYRGRVFPTPVVDVLTGKDIGIDDYHHFARILPSKLTEPEQRDLASLAVAGVQALDMTSCAAHVEFIGRRLGEIAARPGGNRPRILELAYGMDELYAYYQVLRGQSPDLKKRHFLSAAIVTPFPRRTGVLREFRHLEKLVKLPAYVYHEIRAKAGQVVGLSKGGFRAPLYVELVSQDSAAVRHAVAEIASWSDIYELD